MPNLLMINNYCNGSITKGVPPYFLYLIKVLYVTINGIVNMTSIPLIEKFKIYWLLLFCNNKNKALKTFFSFRKRMKIYAEQADSSLTSAASQSKP